MTRPPFKLSPIAYAVKWALFDIGFEYNQKALQAERERLRLQSNSATDSFLRSV